MFLSIFHTFDIGQTVLKKNLRKVDRKGSKKEHRFLGPYTIRGGGKGSGTYLLNDEKGKRLMKAVHGSNLKAYKEGKYKFE